MLRLGLDEPLSATGPRFCLGSTIHLQYPTESRLCQFNKLSVIVQALDLAAFCYNLWWRFPIGSELIINHVPLFVMVLLLDP